MMRKFLIIPVIVSLLSSPAFAVELEDALNNAYNENNELKSIRNEFVNGLEGFQQALANYFLPDINASVTKNHRVSKAKSQYVPNATSSQSNSLQKSITWQQPIFNGGSGVAALKAAQENFRSSRSNFYAQEQSTIFKLIQAYLEVYQANETYRITEISVENTAKQLEAIQEKLKVGEATTTNLATAQAGLAKAETAKFDAYTKQQAAKASFFQAFGIEADNITLPKSPEGLPQNLDDLMEKSIKGNPSIDAVKNAAASYKTSELVAKGALLPQVNFTMQASRDYNDPERANNPNSIQTSVALSVSIPIYSRGGAQYSAIRQAKNKTRSSVIQLDSALKQNKTSCITSWESFNASKSRIEAASKGVAAAEISYEGMVQEELVGTKDVLEVLNAQDNLNQARLSKVQSEIQYILAAYQMKLLLGQLTAKSLKLKVDYFNPEAEFKKMKLKIIGF